MKQRPLISVIVPVYNCTKYLSDYEIRRWNETNVGFNTCAYEQVTYAVKNGLLLVIMFTLPFCISMGIVF